MKNTTSHRDCLVAVITNDTDLARFRNEHWYRVPARAVGHAIAADALNDVHHVALYQTGAIRDGLQSAIELHAPIESISLMPRRAFIPNEPDHPSADEPYHIIHVKRVEHLESPIVSRRPRRITFLRTTHERLLRATDINDLFVGTAAEETLWPPLRELGAERRCFVTVNDQMMEVDFAIVRGNRCVGVICSDEMGYNPVAAAGAWSVVRFSTASVEQNLGGCLHQIVDLLQR